MDRIAWSIVLFSGVTIWFEIRIKEYLFFKAERYRNRIKE